MVAPEHLSQEQIVELNALVRAERTQFAHMLIELDCDGTDRAERRLEVRKTKVVGWQCHAPTKKSARLISSCPSVGLRGSCSMGRRSVLYPSRGDREREQPSVGRRSKWQLVVILC
jgi:hypothetical protein